MCGLHKRDREEYPYPGSCVAYKSIINVKSLSLNTCLGDLFGDWCAGSSEVGGIGTREGGGIGTLVPGSL